MPLDPKLKEMLVCPNELPDKSKCHRKLSEAKGEKGVAEGLKCESCKLIYPIKDDIPVMIPEEAVRL